MDYTETNLKRIEQYFINGCKDPNKGFYMGIEIEHFVIGKEDGHAADFDEIEAVLHEIERNFDNKTYQYEGRLVALANDEYSITLEPACQFEISIAPEKELDKLKEIYDGFYALVMPVLEKHGLTLKACGYHPTTPNSELKLIPKKRYQFMDRYFRKIGLLGYYMMRSTCSTQVSIDYYSEEDFAKKFTALYKIAPVVSKYFENSRIADDFLKESGLEYDPVKDTMRDLIWLKTDPKRVDLTGFVNLEAPTFADYAKFIYNTPLIVDVSTGEETYTELTAAEVYKEKPLKEEDINHIISMVFPTIRLKNYLEVRFADSMPIDESIKYSAFIKGLFENPEVLYNYLENVDDIMIDDLLAIARKNINSYERRFLC